MNEAKQILESIINEFSVDKFVHFFRVKSQKFTPREENYSHFDDSNFRNGKKLGEINFTDVDSLLVCAFEVTKSLSERAGKKEQYEKAKNILKSTVNRKFSAGIFIFYDTSGNFRFSLVYTEAIGTKRQWTNFRRFTYFVSSEFTNKTFIEQVGNKDFSKLDVVKESFSVTAVTDLFYKEFFQIYDKIVQETRKINSITDEEKARDFVLLFTIRTIFLGFIQKKKWLGNDEKFIQTFYREYKDKFSNKNEFYMRWLSPLFFEALNSPQGQKVAYGDNGFSKETEENLQMAPYLNGGLFRQKSGFDTNEWILSDQAIEDFFEFLFSHSFTIEENSLEDEDLQLNPEFLGIIFERLVNKEDGAVYTPRPEVDLMCRLSLVKWLEKNLETTIRAENLYELFFKESEKEEEQKQGSFSQKETQEILDKLENLVVCDPAAGSGAFLVGMMQVLDGVEQALRSRHGLSGKSLFERKKQIIKSSLYGVEVKEWAVWICQLRLWLSLFVDAPDDLKNSLDAILPSLDFKVRQGDSLIQRVGSKAFPVSGHNMALSKSIKDKITKLKNLKLQYFDNKSLFKEWELKQREVAIYQEILNTEINEKEAELRLAKDKKPAQTLSLFGDVKEHSEQIKLPLIQDTVHSLENDIVELKEQIQQLKKGSKPLVWGVEFADVFGEKGGFDIVIGNPPYVRQENISDPTGKVKDKKEYKSYLQEMVKLDFPDYFTPKAKINAQSDLYTYFYIRALRLLNPQGINTFICSNSWLDVGYGAWLQEFLLNRCPVELIIDNHAKRSFQAAEVNTIISIIHAPQKNVKADHLVKFVAFKKPFESSIFTENLISIEQANKIESNETYRVYPVTNNMLKEAGLGYSDEAQTAIKLDKYVGDKWGGKYLRAPDIFFRVLEKSKNNLTYIAGINRGITTGLNDFFYPDRETVEIFKIEKEFLVKVFKSPKDSNSILLSKDILQTQLFLCNKTKDELVGTNALKYIEWGEKQKNSDGFFWHKLPTVVARKDWWKLEVPNGNIFWTKEINERLLVYYSKDRIVPDCRLYFSSVEEDIALYCNTTLYGLFCEVLTRAGLGLGARSLMVFEVKRIPVIKFLDLKVLEHPQLLDRRIKTIFEECGIDPKSNTPIEKQDPKPMSDRAKLDNIVFDALELSELERKDVYRAVCRLVWNRISKAKST